MLKDIQSGRIRQYHDLTNEPAPDQERQLAITTEAIPEHEVQDFVEPEEPYTPTSHLNDLDGDEDMELPSLEPVVDQPDATDIPMPEVPAEDVSTRIPSQAATTSNAPSLRSDAPAPRTGAGIMVDEGGGGVLGALRSRQTTPRVSPYPRPFSNPPSLPSMLIILLAVILRLSSLRGSVLDTAIGRTGQMEQCGGQTRELERWA